MFKPGQLVIHAKTGKLWIVVEEMLYGYLEVKSPTKSKANLLHHTDLVLIGNNYRSKK